MNSGRFVAELPGSVEELCLVRFGVVIRKISSLRFAISLDGRLDRSAAEAKSSGAGLLHAERFTSGWRHRGALQYWSGFEALEAWARRAPHAEWWRAAADRMRSRGDIGIYHEAFLVPRDHVESIYMDCPPIGIAAFGVASDPVGRRTTARDRLGRRGTGGG